MSELKRIIAMGEQLAELRRKEESLNTELSRIKTLAQQLARVDIPEAMREEGMTSFALSDGSTVQLKDDFIASISAERRVPAHNWLVEHGFAGLIKANVSVSFGRGELEKATALAHEIDEKFPGRATVDEKVHPQTLLAFVREQAEKGALPPADLFGITPYTEAKVSLPKTGKTATGARG